MNRWKTVYKAYEELIHTRKANETILLSSYLQLHQFKFGNWQEPGVPYVNRHINERAAMAARIAKVTEAGKFGVYMEARDCDCCEYSRTSIEDLSHGLFPFWYGQEQDYEYAEGPMHFTYFKPSEAEEYQPYSYDRVLEAYEDGHPSQVYVTL